jgi:hypothetical protein
MAAISATVAISACKKDNLNSNNNSNTNNNSNSNSNNNNSNSNSNNNNNNNSADALAIYKRVYGATSITQDGDYVVIKTTNLPDHKSPYYKGTKWESTKYEADTDPGFKQNPNVIAENDLTYRIPMHPAEASTKQETPLGPIGVALNGVAFFNQYAAGRQPLTDEKYGFDQYGGHPAQMGDYHYHVEPTWLTANKGRDALLGFLLDGFPVYGPMEKGKIITDSDLDNYHGHFGATADYPNGIYHYHITSEDPYINGDGFYGTPGTVTH